MPYLKTYDNTLLTVKFLSCFYNSVARLQRQWRPAFRNTRVFLPQLQPPKIRDAYTPATKSAQHRHPCFR